MQIVMAGLVPGIDVFACAELKTWMPGTSPGMRKHLSKAYFAGSSIET